MKSSIAIYFTTRYKERLRELKAEVVGEISTNPDTTSHELLQQKITSFINNTRLHLAAYEKNNMSADLEDMKYLQYVQINFLVNYIISANDDMLDYN